MPHYYCPGLGGVGGGGWVEIIRIKAVLSSTELELELSLAKKLRNFSLKTLKIIKKNKKKIGSNDKNLRKLEPQQKLRVLIKKMSVLTILTREWRVLTGNLVFYIGGDRK